MAAKDHANRYFIHYEIVTPVQEVVEASTEEAAINKVMQNRNELPPLKMAAPVCCVKPSTIKITEDPVSRDIGETTKRSFESKGVIGRRDVSAIFSWKERAV